MPPACETPFSSVIDLPDQIESNLRLQHLLADGQRVLVAVSGGLDSMVLLRLLSELAGSHGWHLSVAHFNHQLRGRSSDADERLVRREGTRLGLRVEVGTATVARFATRHKISTEMAARELRHRFLARLARRRGIQTVALAHHADDQVELFFLRLFRGSGGEGLGGMQWHAVSPSSSKVELVRPLLNVTKAALLDYALQHQVSYREDATNASLEPQRNRIRHELLPLLESKYQPALRQTIPRVMEILRAEADLAAELARRWNQRFRAGTSPATTETPGHPGQAPFAELPVAVQRKSIQLQLLELRGTLDFETIERLRLTADRPCTIAASAPPEQATNSPMRIVRGEDGRLRLESDRLVRFADDRRDLRLSSRGGKTRFGGLQVTWCVSRAKKSLVFGVAGQEFLDADKVGAEVVLRHWQPGDRFQPIGMAEGVKLQDLFVNQKIPRHRRHELLVAATAAGNLFWVEGLRVSEGFKLTPRSKRFLRWRWNRV